MKKTIVTIIFILLIVSVLVSIFYYYVQKNEEEYSYDDPHKIESEKPVSEKNMKPDQTTDKKDFEKIIKRLKKYTDQTTQMIDIPIYFINMDKNPDRKEFMEAQLGKVSKNYKRIKGYNGYAIKNTVMDTVDGISFYNNYPALKPAEIGCTMSHLFAIRTAYDNGDEIALIIEDDTVINLLNLLDVKFDTLYKDAPSGWEIISLFHMHMAKAELLKTYYNSTKEYQYLLHDNINHLHSTVGYLINRRGMKKLLDFAYVGEDRFYLGKNLMIAPDGRADYFIYNIATSYYLTPDIFYPNNLTNVSNIHDEHTDAHIKRALEVISYYDDKMKLKDFSKKYDIPVLYINLEKRKDRNERMIKTLSIFPTVERIDAVYNMEKGALGCLYSHIKMLKYAMEKYPGKDVMFCEDDLEFVVDPRLFLYNFYERNMAWDVLVIANYTQQSIPTAYKDLLRTFDSQTCACYLVKSNYIQKILNVFEESLAIYNRFGVWNDLINCTDQCWKTLQKVDMWFVPEKIIAKQYENYSDIEKKVVNYYNFQL